MLHEDLVRELVTELYKMDVAELLEFKEMKQRNWNYRVYRKRYETVVSILLM